MQLRNENYFNNNGQETNRDEKLDRITGMIQTLTLEIHGMRLEQKESIKKIDELQN